MPEKFHGQRSLAGYRPRGRKESDMTEHARTVISIAGTGVLRESGWTAAGGAHKCLEIRNGDLGEHSRLAGEDRAPYRLEFRSQIPS